YCVSCSIVIACRLIPEKVTSDDARVKAMFEAKQFAQRSLDGGTDIAQRGLLRFEISKHYVHAADGLLVLMGFVRRAGSQEWGKPLVVAAIMLLEGYLTTW